MESIELTDERMLLAEIAESSEDEGVLDEAEFDDLDRAESTSPSGYEINSYGADYDVVGLVRRLDNGDIFIPSFQRNFVWSQVEASRFIESLLLGFPVPAIFLSREASNKFLVVDGQQRLKSLQQFYTGVFGERKFRLTGIDSRFRSLAYEELEPEDRRALDNSLIHTIIVQQILPAEPSDQVHSSIYLLFERLNSWGRPLFPQEIRACVDHGPFLELLRSMNDFSVWRNLYGTKSKRLKDEELILRFLALYYNSDQYEAPMKIFLDRFCTANRVARAEVLKDFEVNFTRTMSFVMTTIGSAAFRPSKAFNSAVFDAVSVGLARRFAGGDVHDPDSVVAAYRRLLDDQNFENAYSKATARKEQVLIRLKLATEAFSSIP